MKNHLLTWRLRTLSLREDERVAHGRPVCPPRNEHTARTQAVPLDRAPFAFRSSSFLARALRGSPLWAPLHPPPGGLLWCSYQPRGPDSQGARQGVWVRGGRPATQVALAQPRASLSPRSTWRSCPSWRTTPSRCRAATRRWSRCGSTVCSSVSTCPARPCSSSEPRSICVRWARGSCPSALHTCLPESPSPGRAPPPYPGPPVSRPVAVLSPGVHSPICWNTCPSVHRANLVSSLRSQLRDPLLREALLASQALSSRARDLSPIFLRQGLAPVPSTVPAHSRHSVMV